MIKICQTAAGLGQLASPASTALSGAVAQPKSGGVRLVRGVPGQERVQILENKLAAQAWDLNGVIAQRDNAYERCDELEREVRALREALASVSEGQLSKPAGPRRQQRRRPRSEPIERSIPGLRQQPDAQTLPAERPRVRIYQNMYRDGQELDADFVAADGRRNANTHYRELGLFLRTYHTGLHLSADYTGIVSPKFTEKTGKTGREFIDFIETNPGFDVYFINPYPQNAYHTFNVWEHGDLWHPGLTSLADNLFARAHIDFKPSRMGRNDASTLLYSNYWAGNERFWDIFMDLNIKLMNALESLPATDRDAYYKIDLEYPDPVPVLTFIFERVFSTLLLMDRRIRALGYPFTRTELFQLASQSREDLCIVAAFKDLVDAIDARGNYGPGGRGLLASLLQLRRIQSGRLV